MIWPIFVSFLFVLSNVMANQNCYDFGSEIFISDKVYLRLYDKLSYERIQDVISDKKLTQRELSMLVYGSEKRQGQVSKDLRNFKNIKVEVLVSYARTLEISPLWLLGADQIAACLIKMIRNRTPFQKSSQVSLIYDRFVQIYRHSSADINSLESNLSPGMTTLIQYLKKSAEDENLKGPKK